MQELTKKTLLVVARLTTEFFQSYWLPPTANLAMAPEVLESSKIELWGWGLTVTEPQKDV